MTLIENSLVLQSPDRRGRYPAPMATAAPPRDETTRQRLIDTTLELITEIGVDNVRVKDVLARSGLSNGSLYWFFKNRRSLIDAALAERFVQRIRAETEASAEAVRRSGANPSLGAFIQPLVSPFAQDLAAVRAERIAVLAGALADPSLADGVAAMQRDLLTRIADVIRMQQAAGMFRTDLEPEAVALLVQVVAVGLASLDLDPDTDRMATLWSQIAPVVLAAFRL